MSVEGVLITGFFGLVSAVLGYLLYIEKHKADVKNITADAGKKVAETELAETENAKKKAELPTVEEIEAKKVTFKADYIKSLVVAHNEQTAQLTELITEFADLKEQFAAQGVALQDSNSLRKYFETQAIENQAKFLEAVKKLEECSKERDDYKKQADEVEALKKRVGKLEKVLTDHNISFEDI